MESRASFKPDRTSGANNASTRGGGVAVVRDRCIPKSDSSVASGKNSFPIIMISPYNSTEDPLLFTAIEDNRQNNQKV